MAFDTYAAAFLAAGRTLKEATQAARSVCEKVGHALVGSACERCGLRLLDSDLQRAVQHAQDHEGLRHEEDPSLERLRRGAR